MARRPLSIRAAGSVPGVLAALRPRQWLHFTVLPLAGWDTAAPWSTSLVALLRGVAIAACVLGYGYLLNALADRSMDRDPRKNPLVELEGTALPYWVAVLGLALGASALAATGPAIALGSALLALLSGWVYSVGPRLKGQPVVCTLLNVACFAPLLLVGRSGGEMDGPHWALVVSFSALLLQNQLLHELTDRQEDQRGGLHTTVMLLGVRGTAALAALAGCGVVLGASKVAESPLLSGVLACLQLPYVVIVPTLALREGDRPSSMRRIRRHHRRMAAVSGAFLFLAVLRFGESGGGW